VLLDIDVIPFQPVAMGSGKDRVEKKQRVAKALADDLDDGQGSSLVEFLPAMSSGQFVLEGKSIEVTGLSSRRVKFLLRKFLYVNHLSGYGVLDTVGSSGLFTSSLRQERKRRRGVSR